MLHAVYQHSLEDGELCEHRAVVLCSPLYPQHLDEARHIIFAQPQIFVESIKSHPSHSDVALFDFLLFILDFFFSPVFLP